jgi:hypothetical protein
LTEYILRLLEEYPAYATIPPHRIIEEFWTESARTAPRLWRIRNCVVGIERAWPLTQRFAPPAGLRLVSEPYGGKPYATIVDWSQAEVDNERGVFIRYRSPDKEYAITHPREDIDEWFWRFGEVYVARHRPLRQTVPSAPLSSSVASATVTNNITFNMSGASAPVVASATVPEDRAGTASTHTSDTVEAAPVEAPVEDVDTKQLAPLSAHTDRPAGEALALEAAAEPDLEIPPEWNAPLQDLVIRAKEADALIPRDEFLTAAHDRLPGCSFLAAKGLYTGYLRRAGIAGPSNRPTKQEELKLARGKAVVTAWQEQKPA